MEPAPILVTDLRKVFRQVATGTDIVAIDRLDIRFEPHEIIAIVGQTGCGKSTFFDLMIGLQSPTAGSISIGGKTPYGNFDDFRGRIATVFQQDRLLPWRSALDNARLPLELLGLSESEQKHRAMAWLERLRLQNFAGAYPHELSGGMRQRIAIARAFVVQPQILLADEAFGHLDEVTARELRETFVAMAKESGATAILITHQLEERRSRSATASWCSARRRSSWRISGWRTGLLPIMRACATPSRRRCTATRPTSG